MIRFKVNTKQYRNHEARSVHMFALPAPAPFQNVSSFLCYVSFSAIWSAAEKRDQTDEKQGGCAGVQVFIR